MRRDQPRLAGAVACRNQPLARTGTNGQPQAAFAVMPPLALPPCVAFLENQQDALSCSQSGTIK